MCLVCAALSTPNYTINWFWQLMTDNNFKPHNNKIMLKIGWGGGGGGTPIWGTSILPRESSDYINMYSRCFMMLAIVFGYAPVLLYWNLHVLIIIFYTQHLIHEQCQVIEYKFNHKRQLNLFNNLAITSSRFTLKNILFNMYFNNNIGYLINCFMNNSILQKNSVEAISLLVQDYHSRSAIRELNGKVMPFTGMLRCIT